MRNLLLFMLLVFTSVCFGSDKYVDPIDGDDNNTGGSDDPYMTIEYAYNNVDDGDTIYIGEGTYDSLSQGDGWSIILDDAKSVTFAPDPYNTSDIIFETGKAAGYDQCITINVDDISKTVIFEGTSESGFIFKNTAIEDKWFLYWHADKNINLKFSYCQFDTDTNAELLSVGATSIKVPTKTLKFKNCSFANNRTGSGGVFDDFGSIIFEACTLTNNYKIASGAMNGLFELRNIVDELILRDCTITTKGGILVHSGSTNLVINRRYLVEGNTITYKDAADGVIAFPFYGGSWQTIHFSNNDITYSDDNSLFFSFLEFRQSNAIYGVQVYDNTFLKAGTDYSSGRFIKTNKNVYSTHIFNNEIYGVLDGLYLAADTAPVIYGNIIRATNCIRPMGVIQFDIHNNTLISVDGTQHGRCIVLSRSIDTEFADIITNGTFTSDSFISTDADDWDLSEVSDDRSMVALVQNMGVYSTFTHYGYINGIDDAANTLKVDEWIETVNNTVEEPASPLSGQNLRILRYSTGGVIYNNILDAEKATNMFTFDFNPRDNDTYIDYNCYVSGTSCFTNLGAVGGAISNGQDNLEELRTKWTTWSSMYPLNDANSIEADPLFICADSNDFGLVSVSPCLNAGKQTIGGGHTNIGAWQGNVTLPFYLDLATYWLSDATKWDVNDDGIVNLVDFSYWSQ